ncbi:MAG: DUF1289 domain-containing protein, partial [Calditrichaeota bacterium]
TLQEIANWSQFSNGEKLRVLTLIKQRKPGGEEGYEQVD